MSIQPSQITSAPECDCCTLVYCLITVFIVLILCKIYFSGGKCKIKKNLSGKVAVITGGNTGIGKQTARELVSMGCKVIIGARDSKKNQETVNELNKLKKGQALAFQLDLAKRQSIVNFCNLIKDNLNKSPIHYLINNAGIMALPTLKTSQLGVEMQMSVNHFGHFLLTYQLWPLLKISKNPRIINLSSRAHIRPQQKYMINFEDMGFSNEEYQPFAAYSRSKKANLLFAKELQKRMQKSKIDGISVSVHPGVVRTELARDILDTSFKKIMAMIIVLPIGFFFLKSASEGAQTSLYTVLESQDKLQKGDYYVDCKPGIIQTSQCRDPQAARKLWETSQKILGIKFDL